MRRISVLTTCLVLVVSARAASAELPTLEAQRERAAAAIQRGLPLVEQAAMRYPEHRKCFSCHHQTLPMLAQVSAKHSGLSIDQKVLDAQAEFTHASFSRELDDLRKGEGIGGRSLTVGYGLWALGLGGRQPDEVSQAMVAFLLKTQEADGHWDLHTHRPPLEDSLETSTVLAVIGLKKWASQEQRPAAEAAIEKVKTWVANSRSTSQEDRIARLWLCQLLEIPGEAQAAARQAVLSAQRGDGGWSQLDSMESDAYATGMTLCVLSMTGAKPQDESSRRAVQFLLDAQQPDGSWHVATRSKPVQVYFDNGDPHGKDQFISTPASCWALVALAMSLRPMP